MAQMPPWCPRTHQAVVTSRHKVRYLPGHRRQDDAAAAGQLRERREGGPGDGLAIVRSTVYNVCMPVRAMQEATFMILTALANGSQHGAAGIID